MSRPNEEFLQKTKPQTWYTEIKTKEFFVIFFILRQTPQTLKTVARPQTTPTKATATRIPPNYIYSSRTPSASCSKLDVFCAVPTCTATIWTRSVTRNSFSNSYKPNSKSAPRTCHRLSPDRTSRHLNTKLSVSPTYSNANASNS